jgi:hypothetical protein
MVSFRDMVIAILTRFRKQEVKTAPQAPSEFMATVDLSRAELDRITTK